MLNAYFVLKFVTLCACSFNYLQGGPTDWCLNARRQPNITVIYYVIKRRQNNNYATNVFCMTIYCLSNFQIEINTSCLSRKTNYPVSQPWITLCYNNVTTLISSCRVLFGPPTMLNKFFMSPIKQNPKTIYESRVTFYVLYFSATVAIGFKWDILKAYDKYGIHM